MGNIINNTDKEVFLYLKPDNLHSYDSETNEYIATEFDHKESKGKKLDTYEYYTKKQFNKYLDELPDDKNLIIIGNVLISQNRYKNITEDYTENDKLHDEKFGAFEFPYTSEYYEKHKKKLEKFDTSHNSLSKECQHFDLLEAKNTGKSFYQTVGYVEIAQDKYVRLIGYNLIPFILFWSLLLGLLLFLILGKSGKIPNFPSLDNGSTHQDGKNDITHELPPDYVFPHYTDFEVTSEKTDIGLYNPASNVKGIQFYLNDKGTDVKRNKDGSPYTTEVDSALYLAYKLSEGDKVLIETQYIEPGKERVLNLYKALSPGEHTLKLEVTSYSFDDQKECTSYSDEFKVTVKK